MKLRLAEQSDFEVYKKLFDDWNCNMLYQPEESDIKPQQKEDHSQLEFDETTLKLFEDEFRRTPEKFAKDISKERYMEHRIYIIQENAEIIGMIEMFKCAATRWKVEEICIAEGYQTKENFATIIDLLLKMPYVKVLDVCVIYDSCKNRLLYAKFNSIGGGFFRRES